MFKPMEITPKLIERSRPRFIGGAAAKWSIKRRLEFACPYHGMPEAALGIGILVQAVADLKGDRKGERAAARRFILGGDFAVWCNRLGIDPRYARSVLREHLPGALEDEEVETC